MTSGGHEDDEALVQAADQKARDRALTSIRRCLPSAPIPPESIMMIGPKTTKIGVER